MHYVQYVYMCICVSVCVILQSYFVDIPVCLYKVDRQFLKDRGLMSLVVWVMMMMGL